MIDIRITAATLMVLASLGLTACHSEKADIEKAVKEALKDSESAKFGDTYINKETGHACVIVNAKNSMGGYVGDHVMFLEKTHEGWQVDRSADEEQSGTACQIRADQR
jgi:hypothetical protein